MKIKQSPQIVDLEEEEPKEQVNMDMVESGTSNVEVGKGRTGKGGISTRGIELQGQGITTRARKSELVTRTDKITKHGCSCTFYCRSWAKH
jgi:hypothetical protein